MTSPFFAQVYPPPSNRRDRIEVGDITVFARLRRPAVGVHINSFAVGPKFCRPVGVWVEVVVAGADINSRLEDYYVAVVLRRLDRESETNSSVSPVPNTIPPV
jgi:hypothetical protein